MTRALLEAEDIAARAGHSPGSAHLLLAFFTFPNRAQVLLTERGVDEERILAEIRGLEDEPPRTLGRIRDRARELARGAGSKDVDCLHLLIALTRLRDAFAYKLLERTGTSVTALRNVAVSYVTGNMPRRYRTIPKPERAERPLLQPRTRVAPATVVDPDPIDEPEGEEDEFDAVAAAVEAAAEGHEARIELTAPPAYRPAPAPIPGVDPLEQIAPTLAGCGVNLVELARNGEIDIAIGRDAEL